MPFLFFLIIIVLWFLKPVEGSCFVGADIEFVEELYCVVISSAILLLVIYVLMNFCIRTIHLIIRMTFINLLSV